MKILELRLTAFGPFTDRVVNLSAGSHGLHVIFGPNEAGKSSALRALHALLYGIPGQTSDAFLHPYESLRLGGHLRLSAGDEIEFIRRKGNKGTLRALDGTRLDDRALDRFLCGVGHDQFEMFWGIDHAKLVQGGKDILEGHGDLGESLFAAGTGASHLGSLRRELDEEAETLFAPRGQKRLINQGIGLLRDIKGAQRDVLVSADEWTRHDRTLRELEARIGQLTERLQRLIREKSRLARLKRVLPLFAERDEVRHRLADLGDVVLLAPDFSKRRQDAETALHAAQQNLERAVRDLQEQEGLVATLGPTPTLAVESDPVTDLHQRLGSHRKAFSDRPALVGQRDEQRTLARRLFGELRPDLDIAGAETLRRYLGRRARIQKLASERGRLDERSDTAVRRHRDAQEQAGALARELSSLPPARDPEKLVGAIEEARRRGDVEAEREKLAQAANRDAAQRDAAIERLQIPAAMIDTLQHLRVPTVTAITRFERAAQALDEEARAAKSEHQRITKTMREIDATIEALRIKKAVPTEEDLAAARARRDSAFGLLRDQWEKARDVAAQALELLGRGKLIDLYPGAVTAADGVADRLRSEADRVAELAQAQEERGRLARDLEEADAAALRHQAAVGELAAEWRDAWKSVLVVPPPIHDGRVWCQDFARVLERSEAVIETRQQHDELARWIEEQVKSLRAASTSLEAAEHPAHGLSMTVASAQRLHQRIEGEERIRVEHARKTIETNQEIHDAEAAVRAAQTDLEAWQRTWHEAVGGLLHGDDPLPDDALVALDGFEKVLRAIDDAADFEVRIAGIDRDAETFRADVRALAGRLGETAAVEGGSEDAWVEGLHRRLAAVLQEDERRRLALTRLERLRTEVVRDDAANEAARLTISALREEAACGADGDLVDAEQRSADKRRYQADFDRIEKDLVRSGDGASIEELEGESVGADRDAIDVRLGANGTELLEVDRILVEARDARATAQAELRRLQGPSVASEKAEDIQATLARLRGDVIRYARLRVASTLLARRIDDYRRKNQAPLLLRASTLFREVTVHSFERLEADVEDDRPILVGVRPNGARVPPHGMSGGTRDQLFFALRLAAVEASCAAGEPMPFVVDDILVQFDDDRGAAALRVLADVASRTQVVLFTHHQQVRAGAEAVTAPAMVIVHAL